jgi:hypothetical protein
LRESIAELLPDILTLIRTKYHDASNGAFWHFQNFAIIFEKTAPNGVVSIIDSS